MTRREGRPRATRPSSEELVAAFAAAASSATVAPESRVRKLARAQLGIAVDVYRAAGECAVLSLALGGTEVYLVDWQIDDQAGVELFHADGSRFASSSWDASSLRPDDVDPARIAWTLGPESEALERHRGGH